MPGIATTSVIAIALAGVWILVAAALSFAAARRLQLARTILGTARANATLVEISPARPLIVRADNRLECDSRLVRELGLKAAPKTLADLHGNDSGLDTDDLTALTAQIETARASAAKLTAKVRIDGSPRVFEVRGGPAPEPETPGTLLLWFFDTSAGEEERADLALRLRQTEAAFNSLTQLIEAAPFPMWYRGPDLKLGMVNSAFVRAVEGKDAQDVIERSAELVDAPGADSPISDCAQGPGERPHRLGMQPAIIHGERRMLQIVEVPLGDRRGRRLCDRRPGPRARPRRARPLRPSPARLADRLTAGVRAVRRGPQPDLLQPAVRGADRARPRLARRQARVRPGDRADARDQRLPEVRDFPDWKEEQRNWFTSADEVIEEDWMLPGGDHLRVVAQPLPDGGLLLIFEDRTEQLRLASARDTLLRVRAATFDNLFEAIGVFASDGRLYLWNNRFIDVWEFDEE